MQIAKQLFFFRKIERKHFRKHINWLFDTCLTKTKFSKRQNYCDNERIFVIFVTLKCVYFVLQLKLNKKYYYMCNLWLRCNVCNNCTNAKILMINRIKNNIFFFENLNFQLMKIIKFNEYKRKIDQNFSRSIIRVKRIYWSHF